MLDTPTVCVQASPLPYEMCFRYHLTVQFFT